MSEIACDSALGLQKKKVPKTWSRNQQPDTKSIHKPFAWAEAKAMNIFLFCTQCAIKKMLHHYTVDDKNNE